MAYFFIVNELWIKKRPFPVLKEKGLLIFYTVYFLYGGAQASINTIATATIMAVAGVLIIHAMFICFFIGQKKSHSEGEWLQALL